MDRFFVFLLAGQVVFSSFYLVGLFFLVLIAVFLWKQKGDERSVALFSRKLFYAFVFLRSFQVLFLYGMQYILWQRSVPGKYLLPPYQSLGYFWGYSWQHFGKEAAVSFLLSIAFFGFVAGLNSISRGRFFYQEEQYTSGLAILVNLWPQNLLVPVFSLFIGSAIWLGRFIWYRFLKKENKKVFVAFRYLWILIGIALVFWGDFFVEHTILGSLKL